MPQDLKEDLKGEAGKYWLLGCNVVPVKQKKPVTEWGRWQTQRQTAEEFDALPWTEADGFGIVCGTRLENGLYFCAVDLDVKNLPQGNHRKRQGSLKALSNNTDGRDA